MPIPFFYSRVWSVRFNHFHDQLILTASSDSRVVLNNVSTISSEPFGKLIDEADEDDDAENGDGEGSASMSRCVIAILSVKK